MGYCASVDRAYLLQDMDPAADHWQGGKAWQTKMEEETFKPPEKINVLGQQAHSKNSSMM